MFSVTADAPEHIRDSIATSSWLSGDRDRGLCMQLYKWLRVLPANNDETQLEQKGTWGKVQMKLGPVIKSPLPGQLHRTCSVMTTDVEHSPP